MTGPPDSLPQVPESPPAANNRPAQPPGWTRLLLVALTAYYLYRTIVLPLPAIGPRISDFWWYHQAGRAVLSGASPFSIEDFVYPPLFSFLIAPLALVGYETARSLWFGLSQVFLLAAGSLLWRILGADRLALLAVLSVWALGGAIAESLMLGQINPLLLVLVVASWYPLTGKRRPRKSWSRRRHQNMAGDAVCLLRPGAQMESAAHWIVRHPCAVSVAMDRDPAVVVRPALAAGDAILDGDSRPVQLFLAGGRPAGLGSTCLAWAAATQLGLRKQHPRTPRTRGRPACFAGRGCLNPPAGIHRSL